MKKSEGGNVFNLPAETQGEGSRTKTGTQEKDRAWKTEGAKISEGRKTKKSRM